jgi:hypothetical protein
LLLVDGTSLADIWFIEDPERNFVVVMKDGAWFKIGDFWVTRTRRNGRVLKPAFDRRVVVCGRPVGLPGSHLLGLKRAEAQQRQPVQMAFVGEQFPRAVSVSLGALAADETTVV